MTLAFLVMATIMVKTQELRVEQAILITEALNMGLEVAAEAVLRFVTT